MTCGCVRCALVGRMSQTDTFSVSSCLHVYVVSGSR